MDERMAMKGEGQRERELLVIIGHGVLAHLLRLPMLRYFCDMEELLSHFQSPSSIYVRHVVRHTVVANAL